MNFLKLKALSFAFSRQFATVKQSAQRKIHTIPGEARCVDNTKHVSLRGTYLKGNYNDLPNLIFLTEAVDLSQNWIPFFSNPENRILDYRNVWLLTPRNFGTSDRHPSFDMEECAGDILRFMYQHKITTATLGGHGYGGKVALAFGCYHAERTTGVFNIDSAPLDHRYHDSFKELRSYIIRLKDLDLENFSQKEIGLFLKEKVQDPKWRKLLASNIVEKPKDPGTFQWNFGFDYLYENLFFNKADSIGNWSQKNGLYTGRVLFMFPEYSRWVFLNTNTLPILKVCPRAKGFGSDIFYLQGDENPLNHFIYDFPDYNFSASRRLLKFLTLYDGVHTLLQDRSEIGNFCIPDLRNSRKNSEHLYSDYSPAHLHHNWRFSNIYEEAEKYEKNPNYNSFAAEVPKQETAAAASKKK